METARLWIGIDVAKAQLDIAIGAEGDTWSVANDDAGIATLLEDLRRRNCGLVVLEATGGFEIRAVSAIAAAGIPASLKKSIEKQACGVIRQCTQIRTNTLCEQRENAGVSKRSVFASCPVARAKFRTCRGLATTRVAG